MIAGKFREIYPPKRLSKIKQNFLQAWLTSLPTFIQKAYYLDCTVMQARKLAKEDQAVTATSKLMRTHMLNGSKYCLM